MIDLRDRFADPRVRRIAAALAAAVFALGVVLLLARGPRTPPSIFDDPMDDVIGFLGLEDFNALPLKERLKFIADLAARFASMEQSDSVVVSGFFAGLTGDARKQLTDNARTLFKDILVDGAGQFFTLTSEEERAAFLDRWLVEYVRYGNTLTGRQTTGTDQEILDRLRGDARRDVERNRDNAPDLNEGDAWQVLDMWREEVGSVASPREQGQMMHFFPAIQQHLLRP